MRTQALRTALLAVVAAGDVSALNAATGAKLWSFATGDDVVSSPAVANGVVYVGSTDDRVYAFDLPGGSRRSTGRPPGSFTPITGCGRRVARDCDRMNDL